MHGAMVDEKAAAALASVFGKERVFHDDLPENGCYPCVQYTDLSESAVQHADNRLYGYEHIIRVTVVTKGNADINELKDRVFHAMTDAGFMWQNTTKLRDGKEYYVSMDYSMAVKE